MDVRLPEKAAKWVRKGRLRTPVRRAIIALIAQLLVGVEQTAQPYSGHPSYPPNSDSTARHLGLR